MAQYNVINIIQCTALSSLSWRSMLRTRDTVSPCGQWWIKDLWYLFSVICLRVVL